MASCVPTCDSLYAKITGAFQGVLRVVVCLSVWSGPVPMMHAHESTPAALERDPGLAEHLWACHRRDDSEACRSWHLHLLVGGEIQPEAAEDGAPVPPPRPRQLESEFLVSASRCAAVIEFSVRDAGAWEQPQWGNCVTLARIEHVSLARNRFSHYHSRVAQSDDVSRLLMVALC